MYYVVLAYVVGSDRYDRTWHWETVQLTPPLAATNLTCFELGLPLKLVVSHEKSVHLLLFIAVVSILLCRNWSRICLHVGLLLYCQSKTNCSGVEGHHDTDWTGNGQESWT